VKTKARWVAAQREELRDLGRAEMVRRNLALRRYTWSRLLNQVSEYVNSERTRKVLEVGGGPTSFFLALTWGEKWAVDPNHDRMFELHPWLRETEEYKDVHFIASPVEETSFSNTFDTIITINCLDHVADIHAVAKRIHDLLSPAGILILVVDCYADPMVRNIIRWFDVDIPHPHHFIAEDVKRLFQQYKLLKQGNNIYSIFSEPLAEEDGRSGSDIRYLIRLLFQHLKDEGHGNPWFALKFMVCYGVALVLAWSRRKEQPVYPLKKPRLFVFQKV